MGVATKRYWNHADERAQPGIEAKKKQRMMNYDALLEINVVLV